MDVCVVLMMEMLNGVLWIIVQLMLCPVGSYCDPSLRACVQCEELPCDVECEFGHVPGSNGCPTCTCRGNPCLVRSGKPRILLLVRSACKCRSIVFAFLILFFFFPFFFLATGPLTRYLKTGCSESDQTWQSGRSPWGLATEYFWWWSALINLINSTN